MASVEVPCLRVGVMLFFYFVVPYNSYVFRGRRGLFPVRGASHVRFDGLSYGIRAVPQSEKEYDIGRRMDHVR